MYMIMTHILQVITRFSKMMRMIHIYRAINPPVIPVQTTNRYTKMMTMIRICLAINLRAMKHQVMLPRAIYPKLIRLQVMHLKAIFHQTILTFNYLL
ncbi:MAG: hypothetical protein A3J76_00970 [Candidatus Moranbacteria bacterium RBG_13_45_13]|nr:MAG: hypothetical protein A3J76_00970 [Candidatus Moranbacteria bacterium RBG_13_45_13]